MVSALASFVIIAVVSLFGGHFGLGLPDYRMADSFAHAPSGGSWLDALGAIGDAVEFFSAAMTYQIDGAGIMVSLIFDFLILVIVWDLLMYIRGVKLT